MMTTNSKPGPENGFLSTHADILCRSYLHFTGKHLINPEFQGIERAQRLFNAPFVVLSHNTEQDPIFTYANLKALELFEISWEEITRMPSRKSAEPPNRVERANLLATVADQGFIDNYAGIRISKTGQRFHVREATVWNLLDDQNNRCGQAATFSKWQYL